MTTTITIKEKEGHKYKVYIKEYISEEKLTPCYNEIGEATGTLI